ncbi:MAG: hypothetical protein WAS33_24465 [Candidatus Promineifilaceae bacterium]|nr:hypothetical protein [Anaerolineaceae bacterium]
MRQLTIAVLLVVGSLLLVACGAGRVDIVRERGSDVFNVTVELNEADMAQLVEEALQAGANPLLRDPVVALQNGQIEVTGTHDRRDGGGRVNGRIVIIPSVQNGTLLLEATEIQIEGVDVTDERIEQFNNNLAERINGRAEPRNRNITLKNVTVSDNLLLLTLDATPRN